MRQLRRLLFVPVLFLVLVVALGCSSLPAPTPTAPSEGAGHETEEEAGHTQEQEEALSTAALRGQEVFNTVGCVTCHGQDAEGTAVAPALPGHTEAEVRRQVRAPVGIMPLFPPDKLTDSQLDDLVAYITSLEGGHAHEKSADVGAEMEMHHWMALFAIEDGNIEEGRHHVQHIIELTEGDHQARMQNVLTKLETGDLHDAAHEIEGMLAGVLGDGVSEETMHLKLALSSARIGDAEGAVHHVNHFIDVADGAGHEAGEAILALVEAGDLEEAEHELVELLEAAGDAVGEEGDVHEEGHEEAEGHTHEEAHEEAEGHGEETPTP